jgi:hypothetical protein
VILFLLLVDDDRIANVVRNKARIALLRIEVCKPLFLSIKPYSGDVVVVLGGGVDLGQLSMHVGRGRNGHCITPS